MPPKDNIEPTTNRYLLRCKILLANHDIRVPMPADFPLTGTTNNNHVAMWWADKALELAAVHRSPAAIAKAHLFRGHCFRQRRAWSDAYRCYVQAASLRTFAADKSEGGLEELTALCRRKMAGYQHQVRPNTEARPRGNLLAQPLSDVTISRGGRTATGKLGLGDKSERTEKAGEKRKGSSSCSQVLGPCTKIPEITITRPSV